MLGFGQGRRTGEGVEKIYVRPLIKKTHPSIVVSLSLSIAWASGELLNAIHPDK